VFVAATNAETAVLVHPHGDVVDSITAGDARPLVADIQLGDSADKIVYPGTHIWEQRRPELYAAAFGVSAHAATSPTQ
jgi:hypothetical protein